MDVVFTEKERKQQTEQVFNSLNEELRTLLQGQLIPDTSKVTLLTALFSEVAFLSVTLSECKALIQRDGIYDEYRNSDTQYGRKRSVAIETYDRYIGHYLKVLQAIDKAKPDEVMFSLPVF